MQIKRFGVITLAVLMLLLTACGSSQEVQATPASTSDAEAASTADESSDQVSEQPAEDDENTDEAAGRTLVIYFSADNTRDVDAVSSATPITDGSSSVRWIAEIIHESVGGDIAEIIPTEDYPLEYNDLADAAKKEADNDARPAIEPLDVDPSDYDTVFIGYPIWWYRMPMVMETFFDTYDFSGVTIIPFNTHAGSRNGGTYSMIQDREPDATVLDGIAIRGEDAGRDSAKDEVTEWLAGLSLE